MARQRRLITMRQKRSILRVVERLAAAYRAEWDDLYPPWVAEGDRSVNKGPRETQEESRLTRG